MGGGEIYQWEIRLQKFQSSDVLIKTFEPTLFADFRDFQIHCAIITFQNMYTIILNTNNSVFFQKKKMLEKYRGAFKSIDFYRIGKTLLLTIIFSEKEFVRKNIIFRKIILGIVSKFYLLRI